MFKNADQLKHSINSITKNFTLTWGHFIPLYSGYCLQRNISIFPSLSLGNSTLLNTLKASEVKDLAEPELPHLFSSHKTEKVARKLHLIRKEPCNGTFLKCSCLSGHMNYDALPPWLPSLPPLLDVPAAACSPATALSLLLCILIKKTSRDTWKCRYQKDCAICQTVLQMF